MLQVLLSYRLDFVIFALAIGIATLLIHRRVRSLYAAARIPLVARILLIAIVVGGVIAAEITGEYQRDRLRHMLEGFAPTYAIEMERLGHANLSLDTKPDDPAYLTMIDAEIRWEKVNPGVNDIYTFRKRADGKVVLLVDSETDYDRNGTYEGDREGRTQIGEEYDEVTPALRRAFGGDPTFDSIPYTDRWGTWVSAYVPLHDAAGNIEGVLGVDYDASTWIQSILWMRVATLGLFSIVAVILLASSTVVSITRAEMAERQRLQRELLDASRQAGMAEIATGVLHNVGNVLNSVTTSATVVSEKMRNSKAPAVAKVASMLRDHQADLGVFMSSDAKGKQLPDYLAKLSDFLATEQTQILDELTLLHRSIDHIKQIVAAQQRFAGSSATQLNEKLNLCELIEDAIRINGTAVERHGIQIEKQFDQCPLVMADRHKVLQILVNLITNASQAIKAGSVSPGKITLSTDTLKRESDGADIVRIVVADNGIGISSENLSKLFVHGFTTRADGHGFGLHASSLAAKQMGGVLSATSAGPGHGAVFTLEVPLEGPGKNARRQEEAVCST